MLVPLFIFISAMCFISALCQAALPREPTYGKGPAPIARGLIGKAKGATVEVEAPGGAKVYKVRQVEWLERRPKSRKPL